MRERWLGLYPTTEAGHRPGGHFAVGIPFPGARIVEVISGLGMTMALGGAPAILDALESDRCGGGGVEVRVALTTCARVDRAALRAGRARVCQGRTTCVNIW